MKTTLCPIVLMTVSLQLHVLGGSASREDYVAHEWGTFTSVQGADGVQFEWNPLITSELPHFVYNRNRSLAAQGGRVHFAGKDAFLTLQRLETPVIYFYSDREQSVDVTVSFPQGIVTEWYPQVRQADATNQPGPSFVGRSVLRWDQVQVLPAIASSALSDQLPVDKSASHYYAARETDAAALRLMHGGRPEVEKFLFYRGIGNFTAPLTVKQSGETEFVLLENTGKEELRNLFVYQVKQAEGKFLSVASLAPGERKSVRLNSEKQVQPLPALRQEISRQMRAALVKEGLYEREAAAMVQTWDDSWFAEQGLRVFYTLPRAWTERILPLTFDPQPRELVRVMVGRAELITPAMEWDLMKQIVRFSESEDQGRAVEGTRRLGLGRFLEPATRRLMAKMPSREFSTLSWELLQEASRPVTKENAVVLK
jgi:hypothetical protein